MDFVLLKLLAQAYGGNAYGTSVFSCQDNQTDPECVTTTATTPGSTPGAADSGVASISPAFLIPAVILFAVVLYAGTLIVLKKLRNSKK